jgi:hypothetical protein
VTPEIDLFVQTSKQISKYTNHKPEDEHRFDSEIITETIFDVDMKNGKIFDSKIIE